MTTAPVLDTGRAFSVEFFPPRNDEAAARLRETRERLASVAPAYYSVTYGAGGSTREGTLQATLDIQQEGRVAVPHLVGVGSSRDSVDELLRTYRDAGVTRLVVLRGDAPSGTTGLGGEFPHAADLVGFVRARFGGHFHVAVAAYPETHPQARSADDDLRRFVQKVDAGADSAITQYFYNADAYFRFVDEAARQGCRVPVVPGIMPITNFTQLARFSDGCGTEIPRWIRRRLEGYGDDRDSIREFGAEVVARLCERLLRGGAPGLHFYTMNQAGPTLELWRRAGLPMPAGS